MSAGLSCQLSLRAGALEIDVQLEVGAEVLALVGPNGAGKTSLFLGLLGLRQPERGRIVAGDQLLFDAASGFSLPVEQRRLAYVPQDYALFPHLTAAEQVEFALSERGRSARMRRAHELLESLGVLGTAARKPAQLSGGERQRIALARALALSPRALLLDEPLAALDVSARGSVRSFLREQLVALRLPAIVITHDAQDALALADRVAVLEAGRIVQRGTFAELAAAPASEYVQRFAKH
ncbi:MAG TPA: ABC transporter ATP-binding protein [Polyangiales bacterium]|nr:ABC transporter ATP-binding protein [Polyangiales bacterium]